MLNQLNPLIFDSPLLIINVGLKMYKILFDTDLILDTVMNRTECAEDVRKLLDNLDPSIQLYITDVGLQKVSTYTYCLNKSTIPEIILEWLQEQINICVVDYELVQKARFFL